LLELSLTFCDDDEPHPGVLIAAEFRAGAFVRSGLVRLQPDEIWMPADHVHLRAQLGDPERVNDVGGLDANAKLAADGDMDLVGRYSAGCGITNLPPPLMTDQDYVGLTSTSVVRHDELRRDETEGDDNQHGQSGPDYLRSMAAEVLLRQHVAIGPEPLERNQDQARDDHQDRKTDDKDEQEQVMDGGRILRSRVEHRRRGSHNAEGMEEFNVHRLP